jgi:hypothetical protein
MSAQRPATPHSPNAHHFEKTMPLDPNRSRSMPLDAARCRSMPLDAARCRSMPLDAARQSGA